MQSRRTQIIKALEDLCEWQSSFKFQMLAFHLAKNRWPELGSMKWSNDEGQDAITIPSTGSDGVKRSLACSLTGTIEKIRKDCKRIKECDIIDFLIFVTSTDLDKKKITVWEKKIKEEFGHKLVVLPRQTIVADLERPENEWICKEYLGLDFSSEPGINEVKIELRNTIIRVLEGWKREYNYNNDLIELNFRKKDLNKDNQEILSIDDFCNFMQESRKIILKGVPGAGKSITLLQISEKLLHNYKSPLPILISLPLWASSSDDLLAFICKNLSISKKYLENLCKTNQITFLMNGWNEIPIDEINKISQNLKDIIMNYPDISFIITTRESYINPHIINSELFYVDSLTLEQRRQIVKKYEPNNYTEIIYNIENNSSLNEITKVPLFLISFLKTIKTDTAMPVTRYEIISEFIVNAESEHSSFLESNQYIGSFHRDYLSFISYTMTKNGYTNIRKLDLYKIIASYSRILIDKGFKGIIPDVDKILKILCDHHLIVLTGNQNDNIRFLHQQFQEWFAAEYIFNELKEIFNTDNSERKLSFLHNIMNYPQWEEPLFFLMEHLKKANLIEYCTEIINMAMKIDLVFASELSYFAGQEAWIRVGKELNSTLRNWYAHPEQPHKDCALTAMLATRQPDFADIIIPLIENSDQQIRLNTYRKIRPFPIESIGNDWRDRFNNWTEELRQEFINEMMWVIDTNLFSFLKDISKNDPSPDVRCTAMIVLAENGDLNTIKDILNNTPIEKWPDNIFTSLLRWLPLSCLVELSPKLNDALLIMESNAVRKEILSKLYEIDYPEIIELLKEELESNNDQHICETLIPLVFNGDSMWICNFLVKKLQYGHYWQEQWIKYLRDISDESIERLIPFVFEKNNNENELRNKIEIFSKVKAKAASQILISKYIDNCDFQEDYQHINYAIMDALREVPLNFRVEIIINKYTTSKYYDKAMHFLDILISFPFQEGKNYKAALSSDQIIKLKDLILIWDEKLVSISSNGHVRAKLAYLLGHIGDYEDIKILVKWIEDEKNRVLYKNAIYKEQLEKYKTCGGSIPLRDCMNYSNYYAGALAAIDCEEVYQVFLNLLDDPEFIGYASSYITRKALKDNEFPKDIYRIQKNYEVIFKKRQEHKSKANKCNLTSRNSYADIIRSALIKILDKYEYIGKEPPLLHNISNALIHLALIDNEEIFPIVNRLSSLYDYAKWDIAQALEILIYRGLMVPGEQVFKIVNSIITEMENKPHYNNDNEWNLVERYLFILLFSDLPRIGIERIKQIPQKCLTNYRHSRLIEMMGFCNSPDAITYISELSNTTEVLQHCFKEYMTALSKNNCTETKMTLINILNSINEDSNFSRLLRMEPMKYRDLLAETICTVAKVDIDFWKEIKKYCCNASCDIDRIISASILEKVGTEEAAIIACNLLNDESNNGLQYYFMQLFEHSSLERVEADSPNSYYLLPKSSKDLRAHLMNLALNDKTRKNSAMLLLSYIETLRIEYGRPINEPRHPNINTLSEDNEPWVLL